MIVRPASKDRSWGGRLRRAVSLFSLAAVLTACASTLEAPRARLGTAPAAGAPEAPPYSEAVAGRGARGVRGDVTVDQINMDYAIQRANALRLAALAAARAPASAASAPPVAAKPPVSLARAGAPPRPAVRTRPVYVAQIGSLASLEAARAEWVRARRHAPVLLKAKTVLVRPSLERRGRFHLIVASFEDARSAQRFCGGLHRRHLACLVMHHREAA